MGMHSRQKNCTTTSWTSLPRCGGGGSACQRLRVRVRAWGRPSGSGSVLGSRAGVCLVCQVLESFKWLAGEVPSLFKADVDSAFRRIPVRPEERWMCGIAFVVDGEVGPWAHWGGLGVCRLFVFLRYGGRSIWPVRSEQLAPCTGGSVLGPQSLTSQGSR